MLTVLGPATAAAMLLLALMTWRRSTAPGRRDLALCLGLGAAFFLFKSNPPQFGCLMPLALLGPLACSRAVRTGFEINPWPAWVEIVIACLLELSGLTAAYVRPWSVAAGRGFNLLTLCLFCQLACVLWRSIPDDLVEARRQARLWFLGTGVVLGLGITLGVIFGLGDIAVGVGAALTLGACVLWVWHGGPGPLAALRIEPPVEASPSLSLPSLSLPSLPLPDALTQAEVLILQRLTRLMDSEKPWKNPGLTLSRLAQHLTVPEHRLRRVIHLGAGERNFSAYLNRFRIIAVKQALEGDADGQTILSVALECGYSSLSAFNRAFRLSEGETPSAFRRARNPARTANTQLSPINTEETTSGT